MEYEFTTFMDFGDIMRRKVSIDYEVDYQDDSCTLIDVWTFKNKDISENITEYLSDNGRDVVQKMIEQDWQDRKQEEAEMQAESQYEQSLEYFNRYIAGDR